MPFISPNRFCHFSNTCSIVVDLSSVAFPMRYVTAVRANLVFLIPGNPTLSGTFRSSLHLSEDLLPRIESISLRHLMRSIHSCLGWQKGKFPLNIEDQHVHLMQVCDRSYLSFANVRLNRGSIWPKFRWSSAPIVNFRWLHCSAEDPVEHPKDLNRPIYLKLWTAI